MVSLAWQWHHTCLSNLYATCFYWLRQLRPVRRSLDAESAPLCGYAGPRFCDVTRRLLQRHFRWGIQLYHRQAPVSCECRWSRRQWHAEYDRRLTSTMICTGLTFPSGCSTAASIPQTLFIGCTCGPPAAVSCSYRDTAVRCSVVGPFLRPARRPGIRYQITFKIRHFSVDSFYRDLKTLLFSYY